MNNYIQMTPRIPGVDISYVGWDVKDGSLMFQGFDGEYRRWSVGNQKAIDKYNEEHKTIFGEYFNSGKKNQVSLKEYAQDRRKKTLVSDTLDGITS